MGDIEHAKIHDFYMPSAHPVVRRSSKTSATCGAFWVVQSLTVVTLPERSSSLNWFASRAICSRCLPVLLGGDFIKNDEPQGNRFLPTEESIALVRDAMCRARTKQARLTLLDEHHS